MAPENGNALLGATPNDENGCYYWIGLLFPPGTPVPDGFEYSDIPEGRHAVFEMGGKKDNELLILILD